ALRHDQVWLADGCAPAGGRSGGCARAGRRQGERRPYYFVAPQRPCRRTRQKINIILDTARRPSYPRCSTASRPLLQVRDTEGMCLRFGVRLSLLEGLRGYPRLGFLQAEVTSPCIFSAFPLRYGPFLTKGSRPGW